MPNNQSRFHRLLRIVATVVLFGLACTGAVHASHNLAGDITYRFLGNNSVEITVTTYTDPSAQLVDRCNIDIEIWDGQGNNKIADLTNIPRINGPFQTDAMFPGLTCPNEFMGEYIVGSVKMNVYKVTYQFSGAGTFLIRFYDLARLDNIVNMNQSGQQAFFIESTISINPFIGAQNSPQFLNHPLDFACTGKLWTHNPGGYDPDGDSLVYTLVNCRQYNPPTIPTPTICTGFQMPDQVGSNGPFWMDPVTGLITWNTPNDPGIYNIAYKIEEYRNGFLIGYSYRDMAIFVEPCNNNPPVIEAINEVCVYAGDTLEFDVVSWDPDFPTDSLYFQLNNNSTTNNGPFSVPISPAQLIFTPSASLPIETTDTVRGQFYWETDCSHLRPQFYQVDFYAHDNFGYYTQPGTQMLSAHKVIKINVIAPPVTGLTTTTANREVTLNWDPHTCTNATGYEIWRRVGSSGWQQDSLCCDNSPASAGFSLVGTTSHRDSVTFVDDNNGLGFEFGTDICYVVIATFPDNMRSCASEEVCIQLNEDFAILTQDSIIVTDAAGSIYVSWAQPDEIDTSFFPTPFTYTLNRADGISGVPTWIPVAAGLAFKDTTYTDNSGMNTVAQGYRYRVDIYDANNELISEGNNGSSIFLSLIPGDKQLRLNWSEFVPWENSEYYIFRADQFGGPYLPIDTVAGTGATTHTYLDTGLENFEDYCYYVIGNGAYAAPGVKSPLLNASQKVCDSPRDETPPCIEPTIFDTTANCVDLSVTISWTEPDSACAADVDYYNIWFSDRPGGPWTQIATVDSGVNVFSISRPNVSSIADCYAVTAVDTNGNESERVEFCFDNCPVLEPSNVFTPNGDGMNDYWSPFMDRTVFVRAVVIYDRWGNKVFEASNVENIRQLWDGRTNGGKEVPEGVYFYVIKYDEDRLTGPFTRPPLSGNVTLLR